MRKKNKSSYIYYIYDLKNSEMCIGMYKDIKGVTERIDCSQEAIYRNLRREVFIKNRYNISKIKAPLDEIEEVFR